MLLWLLSLGAHRLVSHDLSREARHECRVLPCRSPSPSFVLKDLTGPEPHVAPLPWLPSPRKRKEAVYCFLVWGGSWSYRLIKPQTDSSAVGWDRKCCYNSKRPEMTDGAFSRLCHCRPRTRLLLHPSASGPCSMGRLLCVREVCRQLGGKVRTKENKTGSVQAQKQEIAN